MIRKRSLVFLVTTTLFLVLSVVIGLFYARDTRSEYEFLTQRRINRLAQVMTQIQISGEKLLASSGSPDNRVPAAETSRFAEALLDTAYKSKDVDFYIIHKDGKILKSVNAGPVGAEHSEILNKLNEVQLFDSIAVASVKNGDVTVTAGFKRDYEAFKKNVFSAFFWSGLEDLVIIVGIAAALLFYFSRDLVKLVKRLELGIRQASENYKPISRESDQILKTLRNFEDRFHQMESSQQHFKNQLFSAITHELNSKRVPPYNFACTMARVDLNGYSDLNRVMDPGQFRKVIDHLFIECMAMVTRYGGFMSEYLGDEIIFYFKDDQWPRSSLVAVGCITQLNRIAQAISEQYRNILPFDLKFKSALSHGKLTVSKGARELEISGFPFIESVRILKEIKERNEFIIVASPEVAKRLESFVPNKTYAKVDLKGIGETQIYQLELDQNLNKALESGIYEGLDRFRDADSLITILQWIQLKVNDKGFIEEKLRPILPTLFSIVGRPFQEVKLEAESRNLLEKLTKADPKDLATSSFVSLVGRLVSPDSVSAQLTELLAQLSKNSNIRIRANAIEAMGRLGLSHDIQAPGSSEHNRVVANYMIATGTREFSRDLTYKLGNMLKGKSEYMRASALFAIGEIFKFHLERNPVHFRSSETFQSFIKSALKGLWDSSEMVRRQALKMAAKVDDPTVSEEVEKYRKEMIEKGEQTRLAEVKQHYDPAA